VILLSLLDDDLQHPPEEIPKLINHILNNPEIDVVMGAYLEKNTLLSETFGTRLMRNVTNSLLSRWIKACSLPASG
jgi:hypothetical protein